MSGRPTVDTVADGLVDLAELLFEFASVNRTSMFPDGVRRESDTDHTVMLGWVACALAEWCARDLDIGLVAQFALLHDLPEAYADDTCTLRPLSSQDSAAKREREHAAIAMLSYNFADRFPWLINQLLRYEEQELPEARFVRGVDKILPELTHLLNKCATPREKGVSPDELEGIYTRLIETMNTYVGEFVDLMKLQDVLAKRVVSFYQNLPKAGE